MLDKSTLFPIEIEPFYDRLGMDYSYLNQAAAASFDASSCSLTSGLEPGGLGPCSYGDLTSCSQMSYRYSMARSYNPGAAGPIAHHLAGGATHGQCGVMAGARQDHRPPMFPAAMNLQGKLRTQHI